MSRWVDVAMGNRFVGGDPGLGRRTPEAVLQSNSGADAGDGLFLLDPYRGGALTVMARVVS